MEKENTVATAPSSSSSSSTVAAYKLRSGFVQDRRQPMRPSVAPSTTTFQRRSVGRKEIERHDDAEEMDVQQENNQPNQQQAVAATTPLVAAAPTDENKKKEQLQVPDQIVEVVLDPHGFVTTRTYRKGRFLGKGGFARCYEVTCERSGIMYAGKIVAKSSLLKPKAKQKFTSEIKIHKSLHHPSIVQFEHFFEDEENSYILLELCRNQSLSDLLRRRKKISESEVRFYIRQLVEGIAYLHSNLIIHRDLKLGNLFLTADMKLKIGDFGLATRLENLYDRKRTMCGTPNYIAPEILSGQKGDGHSFEVDIWSTGVIMYTLLVGKPPFETDDVKDTYKRIRAIQYDFPESINLSKSAQDLIRGILRSEPHLRPSLKAILSHPFLVDEPIPRSLPKTALLITPPPCKNPVSLSSRVSTTTSMETDRTQRFSSSNPLRVPPPPAAARRYPLRSRDVNAPSSSDEHGRLLDSRRTTTSLPTSRAAKARTLTRDDNTHARYTTVGSNTQARDAASSSPQHTSPLGTLPQLTQETTPPSSQDPLEAVHETLSRIFFLEEHGNNDEKLSEFSSATSIVAAAKRLKEIRMEADMRNCKALIPATLWLSQWVDYTSKYGMGYMLSNGSCGVYFNDSTKIVSSPNGEVFDYMERRSGEEADERIRFTKNKFDESLKKKMTLLAHFKSYLVDGRAENEEAEILESQLSRYMPSRDHFTAVDEDAPMDFVKKWVKTRHAMLFCLTNDSFQFNFFDTSKLLLNDGGRVVTYLDREGELAVYATSIVILKNEREDLVKRLRYAKDMIHQMVKATSHISSNQ